MRGLKRLMHLPNREKGLLFEALFAIVIIRIMLQYLTLAAVHHATVAAAAAHRSNGACAAEGIVWAIEKAARSISGSRCLVQALAAQALLVRYNYKPYLVIGVAKGKSLTLEAHAWVTSENQILIGGRDTTRYTTILTLGSLS